VFPDGNDFLRNATGWPIMGHNRYWAVDNVYCSQNGGGYDFVVEKKGDPTDKEKRFKNFAWPTEQRFWDDIMYNSSQWYGACYSALTPLYLHALGMVHAIVH
jgi:hypothetical protein